MPWPKHLPDGCPPANAKPVAGSVYRFVDNDPPDADDFLSWREQNPSQTCRSSLTECQTFGLSVFTTEKGVCTALRRSPFLRKKKPALGTLTSEFGVILNTPSQGKNGKGTGENHHTWWVSLNAEPWKVGSFDIPW